VISRATPEFWQRYRQLPPDVQETLTRHEAATTTDSAEYVAAMDAFYARHVCRIVPHPAELARTFAAIAEDPTVYTR
jgi:L-proline amide hydrolase